jgi:UDP-3-O-[3-hydroxymyristoyl] glucosamine N-acyltransferase
MNKNTLSVAVLEEERNSRMEQHKALAELSSIHPTAVVAEDVHLGRDVTVGPKVVIDEGAIIGDGVVLGAGVYIGRRCRLGQGCIVDPHVTIRENCILGCRVHVQSGAVIGSDGFGFARSHNGNREKIPQVGIVEIGDEAVIGANCTIDRATLGRTIIGSRAVIQPMVQIAHNVRIGEGSIVGSQTGVCGSSSIGDSVRIGCNVGIVGHVRVEDGCRIEDFSGISKNVAAGSHLTGYPAMDPSLALQHRKMEEELPQLYERVKTLENLLKESRASEEE